MAASSGGFGGNMNFGVDWNTLIRPLVTYSLGGLSKNDVTSLMKAIVESEKDLQASIQRDHKFSSFYDVVTALSAHVLSAAVTNGQLQRGNFPITCNAIKVLTESLLARLQYVLTEDHPILTVNFYICILQEFCTGEILVAPEEVSNILNQLKGQELPPAVQSNSPSAWDKESSSQNIKEARRSRMDPAALLSEQLSIPISSVPSNKSMKTLFTEEVMRSFRHNRAGQQFVSVCLRLQHLKSFIPESTNYEDISLISNKINIADIAGLSEDLNLAFRLMKIQQFNSIKPVEAQSLCRLGLGIMNVVFAIVRCFYGEQNQAINPDGTNVINPGLATSSYSEMDYQSGILIVAETIWIQQKIISVLQEDVGLLPTTWLNCSCIFAKHVLWKIRQYMILLSNITNQTSSGSVNLKEVQNNWNEIITSVASHAIDLATSFLTMSSDEETVRSSFNTIAQFKIADNISNAERIYHLLGGDNIIELLIQIASMSYRKACRLKLSKLCAKEKRVASEQIKERKHSDSKVRLVEKARSISEELFSDFADDNHVDVEIEDENRSLSDLVTTEDEDEPDEDDERNNGEHDDEPILGSWMDSVLSHSETSQAETGKAATGDNELQQEKNSSDFNKAFIDEFVRNKNSADGFIEASLSIVGFLSRSVVGNRSEYVLKLSKSGLNNESVSALIAVILLDLDFEKADTEIGAISTMFDDNLNRIFVEFSFELTKLVQNILALNFFSPAIQKHFLEQLGVNLNGSDRWPLGLRSKTLAVLIQVLLLKQDKDSSVVSILKRTLDTLTENIMQDTAPEDYSDLTVEHAQTLIFLFHTLSLMQKKQIMIECSKALVAVTSKLDRPMSQSHQIMSLGRLLLLFDYFVRQLYEPSQTIITQIQYNLFNEEHSLSNDDKVTTLHVNQNWSPGKKMKSKISDSSVCESAKVEMQSGFGTMSASETMSEPPNSKPLPPARIFCDCSFVENAIPVSEQRHEFPKPKFYNLIASEPNYQENPRLDGLAMNFLMNKTESPNNKDKLEYICVMRALLKIAEVSFKVPDDTKLMITQSQEAYYVMHLINRLIFSLPPPHEYLEYLQDPNVVFNSDFLDMPSRILYLIVWLPRLQHRVYFSWIRDILCKQGMTSSDAETLINGSAISSKVLMKMINKSVEWISHLSNALDIRSPSFYFGIEAVLAYSISIISEISEEEELLVCLIRMLEESLNAAQNHIVNSAFKKAGAASKKIENIQEWKKSAFHLMGLSSAFLMKNPMSQIVNRHIQSELKLSIDEFVNEELEGFPDWRANEYKADILPIESHLLSVLDGHMASLKGGSLKHILDSTIKFISATVSPKNSTTPKIVKEQLVELLMPRLLSKVVEYLGEVIGGSIDPSYAKTDVSLTPKLIEILTADTLRAVCNQNLQLAIKPSNRDEFMKESLQALHTILSYKEKDRPSADVESVVLNIIGSDSGRLLMLLVDILMTTKDKEVLVTTCDFISALLNVESHEKETKHVVGILCMELPNLEDLPQRLFRAEFMQSSKVVEAVCNFLSSLINLSGKDQENRAITKLLTNTIDIVKQNLNSVSGQGQRNFSAFEHVLKVITLMAGMCDTEEGHVQLFRQMVEWLHEFSQDLEDQINLAIATTSDPENFPTLQAIMTIMEYIIDIGKALQQLQPNPSSVKSHQNTFMKILERDRENTPGTNTPPNECEDIFEIESETGDDHAEEEESGAEDSDEEGLNSRLCTYTVTQKEFMSQHWYHCHTCGMVDGVGCCSICAKVCHKSHDVTYAKYGSFFCDCGAKTDGSCQALVRRQNVTTTDSSSNRFPPSTGSVQSVQGNSYNPFLNESGSVVATQESRRPSSPVNDKSFMGSHDSHKERMIRLKPTFKTDELLNIFKQFCEYLPLDTIMKLAPAVQQLASLKTPIGAFLRVRRALEKLRKGNEGQLELRISDDLMLPTLGSQEGAFENIKLSYNGDQGSTIRQLINSQVIRRTTITALAAPGARRHYLAMSQEKGKLTILQLGALLSGADTGKKKLTLPRLASVNLPFTILTMQANPLRDDVIAVCGLKECHVLVIGTGGSLTSHYMLQPQLEGQNHIIKPLWLPGSQTQIALLTAESVKIYDLGSDVISPSYYFLLPSGKVRDATFVVQDDTYYILIIANDGRIYYEKLCESTSASSGQYYITNDLNYVDTAAEFASEQGASTSDKKDKDAVSVSIHYSHPLKLLFYTSPNGYSYVGVLENLSVTSPLIKAVVIHPYSHSSTKGMSLGLSQWTEVLGHPGLIFAFGKDGTPYAMMLTDKRSEVQEIKVVWKSKQALDMVAMRHVGQNGKFKTSLVILGEDGSLKVFDSSEHTEYWLSPKLRPQADCIMAKLPNKKVSSTAARKSTKPQKTISGQPTFPTDFFEHCQTLNDIEFGGNDLLQIYNVMQLKTRLNAAGMYVVSTKSSGFNLEVTNNDASTVITGIRVMLGSQDTTRVPSYIQIFGRTINVTLSRARWYDVPLLREESLQGDNKLTITFGPSHDSQSITFVDSVKIYGKNKDAFGWPDDSEESASQCAVTSSGIAANGSDRKNEETVVEKIIVHGLDLCELAVVLCPREINDIDGILKTTTDIYLENYAPVTSSCRNLMCSILSSKSAYYEHRDKAMLIQCVRNLLAMSEKPVKEVDPELFHHVVSSIKTIAVVRPIHICQFELVNYMGYGTVDPCMIVETICKIFEKLVQIRPRNAFVVSVDEPGIQRVELLAMGITEIVYSVMASDISLVQKLSPCLIRLLLSRNNQVCVPTRTVLVKRLRPKNVRKRRVTIPGPSPPHCATPDAAVDSPREIAPSGNNAISNQQQAPQLPLVEVDEPIVMLDGQDNEGQMQLLNPLDAFMGAEGFAMPPGIDLHSDAEDEAMVELAIALSLQEQAGGAALAIQGIQDGLQALEDMHQEVLHVAEAISPPEEDPGQAEAHEGGAESDATASQNSDDEGSTVATEGSTMRNSEPGGSASSGSSNAEGSSNVGTSSHGLVTSPSTMSHPGGLVSPFMSNMSVRDGKDIRKKDDTSVTSVVASTSSSGILTQQIAKPFRLSLLKAMSKDMTTSNDALSIIPLLQVMLVILAELDGESDEEVACVQALVEKLLQMVNLTPDVTREWQRNSASEMALVVLRMLSILVSRWRGSDQKSESGWIAKVTAETVQKSQIVVYCKTLLNMLRKTWRGSNEDAAEPSNALSGPTVLPDLMGRALLKPSPVSNPPDFSPFFLKQYIKTHSSDILEELPLLLSEMALRLPYQVKKVLANQTVFDSDWEELLCEMLQNRNVPFVRRQARKLLLNIAGSRENYHLLRDLHNIKFHLEEFRRLIGYDGNSEAERMAKVMKTEFKYSQLVAMVEHLNSVIDIASQRPASWQTFCKNEDALQFIVHIGCTADDSLTNAILTLLKIAVDGVPYDSTSESSMTKMSEDEKVLKSLAHQILDSVEKRVLLEFIKKFLLEHSVLTTRWQAHALMLAFFLTSDCSHQLRLVNTMWELWPFVPSAGSRAAQFVDILGYATLNNDELKSRDLRDQVNFCIASIEAQGASLLNHPNANIYSSLVPFVSVDGYYLESEPCEVCFNVDKPYSLYKLNSIKADAKFTANSQIVKLSSTLSIIRLNVRLTEVKKGRMIKNMAIYYSPKNIPIVELKNKPNLWQMARRVNLSPSQTEVKLDFSVPIIAANVMLEFLDFYENVQASAETLQCPRCSASVPAQPGVCSNCGENVYQCHKCRAINYDERDPFICHQCGHCKYAKLEISVLAKNVVAVDPIENEEDAKKAETAVSTLLEKADLTFKQQQCIKGGLESMLQLIKERKSMSGASVVSSLPTASSSTTQMSNVSSTSSSTPNPLSYASAAANALNNNIAAVSTSTSGSVNMASNVNPPASQNLTSGNSGSLVLKNVQSLAYCYAIDCKASYEEINRIMRKVGAYRKEMLKIDPLAYALDSVDTVTFRRCYGCMASSITQSLKLLQALITAGSPRDPFDLSFLSFLLRLSQSAGSTALKEQVKNALCFFVKDDALATTQLTDMINSRVSTAISRDNWNDISFETSEEISLLSSLLQMYDSCWEIKLRSLMKIFVQAVERLRDPTATDIGLLSCLKIIQNFIRATQSGEPDKLTISPTEGVHVDLEGWLQGNPESSFENWRKKLPKAVPKPTLKQKDKDNKKDSTTKKTGKIAKSKPEDFRKSYLFQKYGRKWLEKFYKVNTTNTISFNSKELAWLKKLLFFPGSVQTRTFTAALLKDLAKIPERRLKIMNLLTTFMEDLPLYGESCKEFMELYRELANTAEYAAFLNAKGALIIVCKLLDGQIEKLHHLETVTLHSDLSQGIAVFELSKLLSTLAIPSVRRNKRVSLLSTVLGGYLALKRIRLHRTRPIEEAQEILLQLLEEITSGTEEETKIFMTVCVETLKKCPKDDFATPVFVFERVCSLIVHEESDVAEFFVTLDKDPQQEDFLQGRMLGNPYSSNEVGIGPLMRDIKNKICTDCELVALLEDDNGMELLVNNKIMSLDLPVKEVYKKLWLPTNGQIEPMRVVYRMRGLLGDATEEFVESFASPADGKEDNEVTYKLAKVFVQSGGLKVVLSSLENLLQQTIVVSKIKPLIAVTLKLLGYCAKISTGREALLAPSLNAVQSLIPVLRICVEHDLTSIQGSSGVVHLTDSVLEILEAVLADSCSLDKKAYANFVKSRGSTEDVRNLLELSDKLKSRHSTMSMYFKVLAGLTYTDKIKMNLIFDNFKDCLSLNFFTFDEESNADFANKLEHFCTLVASVETGPYAGTFKDLAIERKLVDGCLEYISVRAPTMQPPLGRPDSDEWKEMASKPALKYILRLLAGFANGHSPSQEAIGKKSVYVIHQLEQVSSDEHVGSLAENVLEALRSHEEIWKKVEAARRATREEKKRMAMAMRQRQLSTMGMKTNDKGQVTAATSSILEQMEDLAEETGLVCVICREGYKYQPTKVLGVYTYSKRCSWEETESKSRKTYGYCTVSHFNVVHVDCHMSAIRLARSRDEWESASLQNANTRCNGLIPLWGPQVPESAFAASLARHNAYLQEATGHRDVGFSSGVHDIKLLLLRFAEEKSFHEDTGGGGPESNMHLIPYLIHTALYVLNTTRLSQKELNGVEKYLHSAMNTWKDDSLVAENTYYFLVVSLMVYSPEKWLENRIQWLKRVISHCGFKSKQMGNAKFTNYRAGLIFLGLIHGLYDYVFKDVASSGDWSSNMADYIRRNDEALLKSTSALLTYYQQKLIAAKDMSEMISGLGLSTEIPDPNLFVGDLWNNLA